MADDGTGAMNNCGSCKWWNDPWNTTHEGTSYASRDDSGLDAELKAHPARWGVCTFIGHPGASDRVGDEWIAKPRSQRAFTADDSDYFSELSTRRDFGCVEWEAKV